MIPTYNCAEYLREALSSVLAQDPGPASMQIEVVDDASTLDDPRAVVEEMGRGRVSFFRQPRNRGHVGNFNTCIGRSRGHLVHVLHGDDSVRDGFYEAMQRGFDGYPEIGAAFCRGIYMDDDGNWLNLSPVEQPRSGILDGWLETIASGQRVTTPAMVVRRSVYEHLGGFDERFTVAAEDWEMWVRIATRYPVYFEREPLALYRVRRPGSLTQGAEKEAYVVREMRLAADVIASYLATYLPEDAADRALTRARRTYAGWALEHARHLLGGFRLTYATDHLREALRCSPSPGVAAAVLRLLVIATARWVRGIPRRVFAGTGSHT